MSLTASLSEMILGKPISDHNLRAASWFVLDTLANAIAGAMSEGGRIVLAFAKDEPSSPRRSAFVMGALCHSLEMDDLHRASVVHPACAVIPAALAIARRERKDGRACLAAILRGYEAACRIGMAVGPAHYRLWHNTATCGPFGSAAAAASLLDLSPAAWVDALGNAGTQASGLWQFLETGAMTKLLHAGRAAEAGILAADLARKGFSGPPAILEGAKGFFAAACPDAQPGNLMRDANAAWQLHETSIKPWPSCRHTHPAIDAALALKQRLGNRTPVSVSVETYAAALDVCDRPNPTSDYEAKFSLQHNVAAALRLAAVDFSAFAPASRDALAPFRARIAVAAAEPFQSAYPAAWGARVTALMDDGELLSEERKAAKGDPELPLTEAEAIGKARMLLAYGGFGDPDRLIDAIRAMPDGGPLPALPSVFS